MAKKKAQKGKQIITGDPMYDELLNKRDSVIQRGGTYGHDDWDYFLKKGIEKVKAQKAKDLYGIVEDDMGQLKHPGKVTKINSNNITMKGVPFPVLGISDTGHKQLMLPEKDYIYKGKTVTEFPLQQNGGFLKNSSMVMDYGKSGINIKPSHKGLLHKDLGVAKGKKIPSSKLAIKSTDSPAVKKRKQFAINAKKWNKGQEGLDLLNPDATQVQLNMGTPSQLTFPDISSIQGVATPAVAIPATPAGGGGFLGGIGEKLGGPMGILNTGTKLLQGIQLFGQGKEQKRQAKQNYELSKLTKQVSELDPEKVKRKYHRPEDQLLDPNSVAPSYGVGTNYLAKNGKNLPSYQEGGFLKGIGQFFNGIGPDRSGNLGQMAGSAYGGGQGIPNGGGQIGSAIGGVAGSLFGPVGGAVGQFLGGALGGALDPNAKKIKEYTNKANKNYQTAGLNQSVSSLRNSYTGFMEHGGDIPNPQVIKGYGGIDVNELRHIFQPKEMDTLRRGGRLPYAMGGELETYWGGGATPISQNPHLPGGGQTVMFEGASHADGGIGMSFGGNEVEVEGGEPAVKLKDKKGRDNLVVFGNMKIPPFGVMELNDPKAKGKKFKNYVKDLSKQEAKQSNIVDKGLALVNDTNVSTAYDKLTLSSGKMMFEGANIKMKDIAKKKELASIVQNAILETADEHGLESDALSRGKIKKAKNGMNIAQSGWEQALAEKRLERARKDEFLKANPQWTLDPENPNRLKMETETSGSTETISTNQSKGGKEFNEWFRKNYNKDTKGKILDSKWGPKKMVLGDSKSKTVTNPGTRKTDYLDLYDPNKPEATGQLSGIQPIDLKKIPLSTPYQAPQQQAPQEEGFNWMDTINAALPYLRPSNQIGLDPNQLAGETLALASNQQDPVQAQLYHPLLEQYTDISLQDQMNANQADFNSIQRSVGNNPAALSGLAGQKYAANSGVLGEQFRLNQANKMSTINKNRNTLNDAQLKNLGILDKQYERQATAKSNTKAVAQSAISSMSEKIQRNKLENRTLGVLENLYNYRFGPKGHAWNLNPMAQFNTQGANLPYLDNNGNEIVDETVVNRNQMGIPTSSKTKHKETTPAKKKPNGGIVRALKDL